MSKGLLLPNYRPSPIYAPDDDPGMDDREFLRAHVIRAHENHDDRDDLVDAFENMSLEFTGETS